MYENLPQRVGAPINCQYAVDALRMHSITLLLDPCFNGFASFLSEVRNPFYHFTNSWQKPVVGNNRIFAKQSAQLVIPT